jgi:hypothetical protein
MTLKQLLESSADDLEKLTDAQLEEWFAPMFNVTRPDASARASTSGKSSSFQSREEAAKVAKAKAIASSFGIDLNSLFKDL